jgi:hypothetical protein
MAHLLYKIQTFISNQGGQKPPQNQNVSYFRCMLTEVKDGSGFGFDAKFRLDTTKSSHRLHTLLTLLSNQGWQKETETLSLSHDITWHQPEVYTKNRHPRMLTSIINYAVQYHSTDAPL